MYTNSQTNFLFKAIFITGIVWMFAFFNCSSRNRNNPLDPKNPQTRGRPTGLQALSDRNQITLSWDPIALPGVTEYRIYKRSGNASHLENIAKAEPNQSAYTDDDIPYDEETIYRISAFTASQYESPFSDSVSITAGPHNYWITDYYLGTIVHLTYDCLHTFSQFDYFIYPAAIATDAANRSAYFLEEIFGYIWKISSDGTIEFWQDGLSHPTDVAFDPAEQVLWVCNNYRTEVVRFDKDKTRLGTITGFGEITDICLSENDGGCWVIDTRSQSAIHLSVYGDRDVQIQEQLDCPVAIDLFQSESRIWIADSLRLIKATTTGVIEKTIDVGQTISALSVDQSEGSCWIAVASENQTSHELWKIGSDGERLVTIDGFIYIKTIQANAFNGGCLVADAGSGCVVRVSNEGNILAKNCTLYTPWDIAVE